MVILRSGPRAPQTERRREMLTERELRERIREQILEAVEVVVEAEELLNEKRTGERKRRGKRRINPPITGLTKIFLKNPNNATAYKSLIRKALKKNHNHIGPAAEDLGVSHSTLQRHIARNFSDGELELAPPGQDPLFDVEAGDWEKKKRED